MPQSLECLRVLDLSRVLAGPYCAMVLADLGADVIKVELPGTGDDARAYGPFIKGESAYYMSINRNKRGITLNLKHPEGRALFLRLARWADVVIEYYRPGTMDRLGLGYADLEKENPRLIYAAVSGFGATGPYRHRPAYDIIAQGMGGLMSITGHPGGPPTRVGASVGDITAGLYTAVGILAAVVERERSGRGQFIDVSMMDCQVSILENAISRYLATGQVPRPLGNHHPSITPFSTFKTADGYIIIAAGNNEVFGRLCGVLGVPGLATDPRFSTNPARTQNRDALAAALETAMAGAGTDHWLTALEAGGVPAAPVQTVDKVIGDPQVAARDMVAEVDHPVAGHTKIPGVPVKMSRTQGRVRRPAPTLGQHNEEILTQVLGLSKAQVDELRSKGAL